MIKARFARFARNLQAGLMMVAGTAATVPPAIAAPVVQASSQPSPACGQLGDAQYYSDESFLFIRKGKGDWLFRSRTDFNVFPPVASPLVENFTRLNKKLKASNVRLVVLVTPPRGAMMRDFIEPGTPGTERYSPDVAMQAYQRSLDRLRGAGIIVPNVTATARDAGLTLPGRDRQFYLSADTHWTDYGAYVSANATARELAPLAEYRNMPKVEFKTVPGAIGDEQQLLRREASRICKTTYRADKIKVFETTEAQGTGASLLDGGGVDVALVGTSFSARTTANFGGFLRQELHTNVANYSISGGGFEASILSYLLSNDYRNAKPKLLIWEMQYHNLDATEGFPLILGAVDGDCGKAALVSSKPVPVKLGQTSVASFDNGQRSKIKGAANLVVNLTSPDARRYHVYAHYTDGRQDRFNIDASRWTYPANKMIIRLPRDGGDLAGVSLVPDQRLSGTVSAHVCRASA
ncbi:hypothetical protein ABAC460_09615 [Asticcacaulis sp. AC460]|uniref:alginate O-acetyltransferase AlgX-related protein n=1 Tax=Asticcacaulis sp. AC460 TaxID=1282360 RepID=UPI0003C3BC27|nr:hypothetical protein [Asticcacaulis sp. AC460]ESQ90014.1 hypothetical protein ABAC460_09615 [Asticcacaulis sp. AC460]